MSTDETKELTTEEPLIEADLSEEFDITRQARQETLSLVEEVLTRAAQGSKITQKDLHKAISSLYSLGQQVDQMLAGIVHDMFNIVKAVAQSETTTFAIRTNLKALVRALEQKEIINQEEMEKVFDEVLNEEIQQMAPNPEESE